MKNIADNNMISVIIPIYNTEKYIQCCLNSVLHNSYRNIEVICINDGSTDHSLEILDEIAQTDERVKVYSQKNSGVSCARNKGLEIATGGYIAFIDSDDWIHSQYFEILLQGFESEDIGVSICEMQRVTENLKNVGYTSRKILAVDGLLNISYTPRLYVWARIYRRELIDGMCFANDVVLGEDTLFNLQALTSEKFCKGAFIDSPLYYYFENRGSAVHILNIRYTIPALYAYIEYLKNNNLSQNGKRIFALEIKKKLLLCRYMTMFDADRKDIERKCDSIYRQIKKIVLLPYKQEFLYGLMWKFPVLYRIFRSLVNFKRKVTLDFTDLLTSLNNCT
jgi:glycosyltransferase involved in cell wall biosynthesis